MLIPNTDRVLLSRIQLSEEQQGRVITPGQTVVGENLFAGKIVHAGNTNFKVDQLVYFSEYSASQLLDISEVVFGNKTMADIRTKTKVFVVAEDDIMAYEDMEKTDDTSTLPNVA